MFRQQIPSSVRIHLNIVTHKHPINVIPASARLEVSCRSLDMEEFKRVIHRVKQCGRAAAEATGCEVEEKWDRPYQSE
jgi:metal-dependent amidase/aminoacylase/carboxypeptidase family protein